MNTTFKYNHYFRYEELSSDLKQLADSYPDLMDLEVNCVTVKGRNQYVAILTNKKTGGMLEKPGWYLDGNIHAGEVTSSMCAMHTIDYLLTNYGNDPEVTRILDTMTVYCIPRVTPDGAEAYLSSPTALRSVDRKTQEEGGGIRECDLDCDGTIRMMRIKTPYGAWKKDAEGQMVLRSPSDTDGIFYDIYPEGILEKFDGDENLKTAKDPFTLDFNRNFPYGWFPEPRQDGAGAYPLSNPETKAIVDFVLAHPNIGGAAIGHTSGGIILYPPGTKPSSSVPVDDIRILKAIADMGKEELGYQPLNIFDSFLSSQENYDSGALDDWMFETQGIPAFTMEFWDISSRAGVPRKWGEKTDGVTEELKRFNAIMRWVKNNAPQYYSDWKKIDHPDFGSVEIGGFNYKFTHQNPPENMLLKEAEADTRFNLRFLKAMPRLAIDEFKRTKISRGIYRIEAVIGNRGYLSTSLTDTALKNHYAKPVKVILTGAEILEGKQTTEIEDLQGYAKTSTGVWYYGNITTEKSASSRKKLSWIVMAEKGTGILLEVSQAKAGKATSTIRI